MIITYSALLKAYIAMVRNKQTPSHPYSMIAVKPTRAEVIAIALQRLTYINQ